MSYGRKKILTDHSNLLQTNGCFLHGLEPAVLIGLGFVIAKFNVFLTEIGSITNVSIPPQDSLDSLSLLLGMDVIYSCAILSFECLSETLERIGARIVVINPTATIIENMV